MKGFEKAKRRLGFGFMRLPMLDNGEIDIEQVKEMVDYFMENGYTYFDTAFTYLGGHSEEAIGEAVVKRYPRESFTIATKSPMPEPIPKEELYKRLDIQLKKFGTDYIDYYLLHNLGAQRIENFEKCGGWEFINEMKEKGVLKHIGFSFHDTADKLDDILTKHPEVDFVQLQINYMDWLDAGVQSKACYDTAVKHGVPVVVMEPIKGGSLMNIADEGKERFKKTNPDMSLNEWALRFIASLDNVAVFLSGMSSIEQLKENVDAMKDERPLTAEEQQAINDVRDIMNKIPTVPCTSCNYCTEVCPIGIRVPSMLKAYNMNKLYGFEAGKGTYVNNAVKGGVKPSECLECHACEGNCPQQIEITKYLKEVDAIYGEVTSL